MKIVRLFCAGGMSTSLLVNKIKEEANLEGIKIDIQAFGTSAVASEGASADVILLGPQVSYELKKVQALFPSKAVLVIGFQEYGMMDGKKVLQQIKHAILNIQDERA